MSLAQRVPDSADGVAIDRRCRLVAESNAARELVDAANRSSQFVRRGLQRLDDAGIIETVTRKPPRFRLTAQGVSLLEPDGE